MRWKWVVVGICFLVSLTGCVGAFYLCTVPFPIQVDDTFYTVYHFDLPDNADWTNSSQAFDLLASNGSWEVLRDADPDSGYYDDLFHILNPDLNRYSFIFYDYNEARFANYGIGVTITHIDRGIFKSSTAKEDMQKASEEAKRMLDCLNITDYNGGNWDDNDFSGGNEEFVRFWFGMSVISILMSVSISAVVLSSWPKNRKADFVILYRFGLIYAIGSIVFPTVMIFSGSFLGFLIGFVIVMDLFIIIGGIVFVHMINKNNAIH